MTDYKAPPTVTATEAIRLNEEWLKEAAADPRRRIEMALFMASNGDAGAMEAIIHLIQLGSWATKHGIPALEKYTEAEALTLPDGWNSFKMGGPPSLSDYSMDDIGEHARDALAALPKEKA